ncbi:hypothetical protein DPMN_146858 [Dreissena polymorpha]|uniref:Uncharacterized protein n=1 Tax=Dreissena polymorpha TaxID=45954 RepID=A0A9D4FB37_DREPO|nr:hypothetical protein DPMN_146858 [Dreissena polymorpha]
MGERVNALYFVLRRLQKVRKCGPKRFSKGSMGEEYREQALNERERQHTCAIANGTYPEIVV